MAVTVYVMPLGTWLTGSFQPSWGEGMESRLPPRPRRSDEDARRLLESFKDGLEKLLAFRPDWDEDGPARTGAVFSAEGFAGPFLLARRWSYRLRLPLLSTLEPPVILIPPDFDPVVHLAAPWNPESEICVASSARFLAELDRLLREVPEEASEEELGDIARVHQVLKRLHGIATAGLESRAPVIIEG